MTLDGATAYLTMDHGLIIMDTTNPAAPVALGSLPPQGLDPFTSVTVDKRIAYLISGWGMTFVDVRTPSHPVVLGNYSPDEANVRPQGVAVYHGMLNISMSDWKGESYVQVVQITDPAHPVTIAKTPVWGRPEQLLDDGASLYIAAGIGGVVSLTNSIAAGLVADPTTPGVKIVDFGFQAPALTVRLGTSVSWSNTGAAEHSVTSTSVGTATTAAWDSGKLASGQVFSHTFDTPGTFAYHCTVHPSMTGTITVVEMNHKAYLPQVGR
jgi:plastocyanin